jgi:serine/threonine protein kinase
MQPRIVDGKYEIVGELSKGGMGAVYEARHRLTRRKVALKLILTETLARKHPEDALRRFEREARAAGSIESRHVVSVLDTGVDAATGDHYIVMERLFGEDLRQLLRRSGKLPPNLVLAIARQVCSGLRRAHDAGVVHRDIKPANIYLARRDDGHVEVKILDFGIAKLRVDPLSATDGHDLTRSGSVLGSPLYMSPEQATGARELDARSDIWSLGVVMYEALTGETPHASRALGATILSICSTPARPLQEREPAISPDVAAVVHQALALDPSQRFANAEAMQQAIDALLPDGSALHESALNLAPEGALEARAETPLVESPDAVRAAPTTVHDTTGDAMTYGSNPSKLPGSGGARRGARTIALIVGAGGLLAALGIWFSRAAVPPPDADAPSSPAAAEPERSPHEPFPAPVASVAPRQEPRNVEPNGVASAASIAPAARRPVARRPASAPVLTKDPALAPPDIEPAPVKPRPAEEPAIDRRFD